MSNILTPNFTFLLHGIDTLEVAYYLVPNGICALDYIALEAQREALRRGKSRVHKVIQLGYKEFLLSNHGTKSGHSFFMENEAFSVAFGEFVRPNFYVKFNCARLWHDGFLSLHNQFLAWAASVGMKPYKPEGISRLDHASDYLLPGIDFDEDNFVSQADGGKKHWKYGIDQTFDFGSGEKKVRVYNKSDEIKQKSGKEWFHPLWGGVSENVWRIEWQTRTDCLQAIGLRTIHDLTERIGDLLRDLATEHTSLRVRTEDTNRSRWPLHPLWRDYLDRIAEMPALGVIREYKPDTILDERLMRCYIAMYGYAKRVAAIQCLKQDVKTVSLEKAMRFLQAGLSRLHDRLEWVDEVEWRVDEMKFGHE